jgi:hypothetical protein
VKSISIADRIGAAAGAAYIVCINVGNQMSSGSSQDPHPTGTKDLADFSGTPTVAQETGFVLEVLGFVFFMFFLGWLVTALRARGGAWGWLATVAGVGGIVTLAVKLGSAAPMLTGYIDHRELTPTLARVLSDMNGSAFVITFLPFAVYVLAAAGAMLATGLAGRVAGWTGLVIGLLGVVAPLASRLDPISTNFVPFLLAMLWTLCVSIRLAVWGPKRPHAVMDELALRQPLPVTV